LNKPAAGFLALLGSPARRALENAGITTLNKLAELSEKDLLDLHGIGKASLPTLHNALAEAGLSFKPMDKGKV
jgi:DNA-directed RNA polymerase alpha subunit